MSNSLERLFSIIQRLLEEIQPSPGGDTGGCMQMVVISQLERSQKLLKMFHEKPILYWQNLIYDVLFRVVERFMDLLQGHGEFDIPEEAREEHFLEILFDLCWWTWVFVVQADASPENLSIYTDCFGAFEDVLKDKFASLSNQRVSEDSITRSLPSFSFQLWQQKTEGRLRELLQFKSEGSKTWDEADMAILTEIRKGELDFKFQQLYSTRILEARKPDHLTENHISIDLTKDFLGISSAGYAVRMPCSDGHGEFCVLKKFDTMDEKPPDLARLWHPHVVHLKHYWSEKIDHCEVGPKPKFPFMTFQVMEFLHGDLAMLMKTGAAPFSLPVAVDLMLQIAKGMLYLHEMGVSHPHLKCDHVLIYKPDKTDLAKFEEGEVRVKLGGFGCSMPADIDTKKLDVNRFGWVCWEILTGKERSEDTNGSDPKPTIPEASLPVLKCCIESCLNPDSEITFSEIVKLLLLAQIQIMQRRKEGAMQLNESLNPETVEISKGEAKASSLGSNCIGQVEQEMFHVHQLHPQPPEVPLSVQITLIFFHGFPRVLDEWKETWMTRDDEVLWPQKWLAEDLGGRNIRVLSVSFDDHSVNLRSNFSQVEKIKEEIIRSLVLSTAWKLGETEQKIILVGHSFGGMIIEALVSEARRRSQIALEAIANRPIITVDSENCSKFMEKLASVVFYSVPHNPRNVPEFQNFISKCCSTRTLRRSKLPKFLSENKSFISEMEKLSKEFKHALRDPHKVLFFLEGEPMPNKYFLVRGLLLPRKWDCHKIPEDNHFEVCRPDSKDHLGYKILLEHLEDCIATIELKARIDSIMVDELRKRAAKVSLRDLVEKSSNKLTLMIAATLIQYLKFSVTVGIIPEPLNTGLFRNFDDLRMVIERDIEEAGKSGSTRDTLKLAVHESLRKMGIIAKDWLCSDIQSGPFEEMFYDHASTSLPLLITKNVKRQDLIREMYQRIGDKAKEAWERVASEKMKEVDRNKDRVTVLAKLGKIHAWKKLGENIQGGSDEQSSSRAFLIVIDLESRSVRRGDADRKGILECPF